MNRILLHFRRRLCIFWTLAFLAGCSGPDVLLPNNYRIKEDLHRKTFLVSPTGKRLIDIPISQFCVLNEHIYGWVDDPSGTHRYFYLNSLTGAFQTFEDFEQLDRETDKMGLPRLRMKDSFTYLDIVTGFKKPTWTNAATDSWF